MARNTDPLAGPDRNPGKFLVTGVIASSVSVIDARQRAKVETDSIWHSGNNTLDLGSLSLHPSASWTPLKKQLRADLSRARHVSAMLTVRATGYEISLANGSEDTPPTAEQRRP